MMRTLLSGLLEGILVAAIVVGSLYVFVRLIKGW